MGNRFFIWLWFVVLCLVVLFYGQVFINVVVGKVLFIVVKVMFLFDGLLREGLSGVVCI